MARHGILHAGVGMGGRWGDTGSPPELVLRTTPALQIFIPEVLFPPGCWRSAAAAHPRGAITGPGEQRWAHDVIQPVSHQNRLPIVIGIVINASDP